MNSDFQQAIEMTRSGDRVGAQKRVAGILKEDPNNAHAWYLLSLLVDSDQKRAVYLSKVVSLDPDHEKAVEQLNGLEEMSSSTMPISTGTNVDFINQEKAASIPDWMADAGTPTLQPNLAGTTVSPTQEQNNKEADVPDWVQEDLSASWIEEDNPIATIPAKKVAKKTPPTKRKPSKKKARKKRVVKRKKKAQQLNMVLTGLIIFAVIIAIMLVYVIFS